MRSAVLAVTLPEFLYRLYDADDRLLYVGITGSVRVRMQGHAVDSPWWPLVKRVAVEVHPDRPSVEAAERLAVATESPKFNVRLKGITPVRSLRIGPEWDEAKKLAAECGDDFREVVLGILRDYVRDPVGYRAQLLADEEEHKKEAAA